jgi:DNA-binding Lrp family transcriptional regulator
MTTDNRKKPAILELDELDMMLAKELELDARQSNVILAEKLNTSQTTVKRRLQRLLDGGVITFATIVTMPLRLQLIGANIGLNVVPGKVGEVAKHLRTYKSIQRIIMTTGRYDMILSITCKGFQGLIDFLDGDLRYVPHLVAAEKIVVIETTKMSWKFLNDNTRGFQQPQPRELDGLDLKLIEELELSPRESFKDMGDKLGVHRKLVARKIQSLLTDNVIQVVSIVEPSFFGLNVPVFILVKVRPGKIRSMANDLVAERRVHHICITSGPSELFVTAVFRDLGELSDFLMNRLGNYEGVVSHETLIRLGFAKRSYSVLT